VFKRSQSLFVQSPGILYIAALLKTAAPPIDNLRDSFEERQRRWIQEDRLGRSLARESLHKFQANDLEVIYSGSPEKPKPRRSSSEQDSMMMMIIPDATAVVYHIPDYGGIESSQGQIEDQCSTTQSLSTTTSIRAYMHPSRQESSSSSSTTMSPSAISPDKSEIPMSSLVQVARTLLMRDDKNEAGIQEEDGDDMVPIVDHRNADVKDTFPSEAIVEDTSPSKTLNHDVQTPPSKTGAAVESPVDDYESDLLTPMIKNTASSTLHQPNDQSVSTISLGNDLLPENHKQHGIQASADDTTVGGEFITTNVSVPDSEPQQSFDQAHSPLSSSLKATVALPLASPGAEDPEPVLEPSDQIIPQTPVKSDLKSYLYQGIAILPVTQTKKCKRAEKPEENPEQSMTAQPPVRKVSEGSNFYVDTDVLTHDEDEVVARGSFDDVLQSFASFGVAILPTVSRSRDEDDVEASMIDDHGEAMTKDTEPMHHTVTNNHVLDNQVVGNDVLKKPIKSNGVDLEEMVAENGDTSIFRPLNSPDILDRLDKLTSTTTILEPSEFSCSPENNQETQLPGEDNSCDADEEHTSCDADIDLCHASGNTTSDIQDMRTAKEHDHEAENDIVLSESDNEPIRSAHDVEQNQEEQPTEICLALPQGDEAIQSVHDDELSLVEQSRGNLNRNKTLVQEPRPPRTGIALLPSSTFLSFPWSTNAMPASW